MNRIVQIVVLWTLLFVASPILYATSTLTVLTAVTVPICPGGSGGSINLNPTGGTPPYTFLWNDGSIAQNRTNLASGNYWVIVTDSISDTDTLNFTINNPVLFNLTKTVTDENCGGQDIGAVLLNVSGGTAPYTFSWNNGDTSQNLSSLTAAVYYVTVTDAHGCTAIDSANVTQPPGVGISSTIGSASCGTDNGSLSITVQFGNPGYTFLWNDGDTAESKINLAAGNYNITVTDSIGCTASAVETVPQLPGMSINATTTGPSCYQGNDGDIDITSIVGSTGPFTYLWNDSTAAQNKTTLVAGTYGVTVTSSTNCTASSSYTLSQPSQISINLTPVPPNCFGDANGGIISSVSGGTPLYTYNWTGGGTNSDYIDLSSGNYMVKVTDGKGCTDTASAFVSQPSQLTTTVIPTNVTCIGGPTGSVAADPSGGTLQYFYWWGAGNVDSVRPNVPAGTYTVTVTDANGCTASGTGTVPGYTPVGLTSTHVNVLCNGADDGSINAIALNGWAPFSFIWNNGDTLSSIDSLAAGTYNVTITDGYSCTASQTISITQPPFPITINATIADVVCHSDSTGSITLVPVNGAAPYHYLWNNGTTLDSITNLEAGNDSVTVTDNSGCVATATFTITQASSIAITHTDNNVTCFGLNTGSILLGVTGGYAPFNFNWNDGGNTQNRTNLAAGNYIVTITDHFGCTARDTSTIAQPVQVVIADTVSNVACYGANTGSINLSVSGGTGPYVYNWGGGINSANRNNLIAGIYNVSVRDSLGCMATASVTINQPAALNIAATIVNAACNGGNTGAISLNVSGGTVPYSFNWGGGIVSQNIDSLVAGTYMVTVTDTMSCVASDTSVVMQASTLNVTATVVNAACNGADDGAITLADTGGTPPYQFLWSDGSANQNRNNLFAGNYSVTITDNAGCSAIDSSTITQSGSIVITPVVNNVSCFGWTTGTINLTVTGGISPYTYNWNDGTTTQNRTGLSAGNYIVTITDSAGCTLSNTSAISQPAQLNLASVVNNISCFGGNNGSININVTGGMVPYSFNWGAGVNTQNLSNLTAATYTVTVTDSNSCTLTNSISLTQPQQLSVNLTPVNVACNGQLSGSINTNTSGGTQPYAYNWSNNFTSANLANVGQGTFYLTVSDANLCTVLDSATVSQPAQLADSFLINTVSCFGTNSGSINTTVTGGTGNYSYNWSNNTSNQNLIGVAAGNYQVTITDANGCSVSGSLSIIQPSALNLAATKIDVSCFGGNSGSINAIVIGGTGAYTYIWNNADTTAGINTLTAGTYSLSVQDAAGCSISTSVNILQPSQLAVNETAGNVSCGNVNNGSVTLSVTGGQPPYSYSWDNGDTTQQISNLSVNSYNATVTDANLCTVTASVNVTQLPGLSLVVAQSNYECSNKWGTINLTVSGGSLPYQYDWADGATTANRTQLIAGNYEVTVTDANSCSASASADVTQIAPLAYSLTKTDVSCNGGDNGTAQLTITDGTPPYNLFWSNGATAKAISNLSAGSYFAYVTDANLCNLSAEADINQPQPIQVSQNVAPVSCNGNDNGSINASATGGTPGYVFQWSNGASSANISNLAPGTYSLSVFDANNCSTSEDNILVSQASQITSGIEATAAACSGLNTGAINLNVNGGQAPYSFQWSNQANTEDLNGLAPGTYTVTITDSKNCSAIASANVASATALDITSNSNNVTCAGLDNGSINIFVDGGTPAYSYNWSNGSQLENLDALAPGSYSVTITDANGCSAESSFTISGGYDLQVTIAPLGNGTVIPGQSVQLNATTNVDYGNAYSWSPSEELSCRTCASTYAVAQQTGEYTISVTDENGCKAIDSILVTVTHADIYIPNAFSPGGVYNGQFQIYGNLEAIQLFQVSIFDRWGEEVYVSNNANFVWDGMYKGEPAPMAVYVYIMSATLADGSNKNYKGSVTLIR